MMLSRIVLLACLFLAQKEVESFLPSASVLLQQQRFHSSYNLPPLQATIEDKPKRRSNRKPSKVSDPDGPTPDPPIDEPIAIEDIPELREIEREADMPPGPIPHQPWRRGMTAGCEAPISAEWRKSAEKVMRKAVSIVGGKLIDVTWYLTTVVVTIDGDNLEDVEDLIKSRGPPIDARGLPRKILFHDPNEGTQQEEIWVDEEEFVYQRETEEEAAERREKKKKMWATLDEDDDPNEPHIPPGEEEDDEISAYMNEETREDAALFMQEEELNTLRQQGQIFDDDTSYEVDTNAISTIAGAILDSLETVEDELQILARHDVVLANQTPWWFLDTQRKFDESRGCDVAVHTVDPWNSNRVLQGKLLERNSMDVIINKKGRMVTIPNNFVSYVARKVSEEDLKDYADEEDDPASEEEEEEEYEEEEME